MFFGRKALGSQYEVYRASANYISVPPIGPSPYVTEKQRPWLAVASLVNPHDITGWPLPWAQVQFPGQDLGSVISIDKPLPIPQQGDRSQPPPAGTYPVKLNPQGFPEDSFRFPPAETVAAEMEHERLTKPRAHYEACWKVGLTFRSMWPANMRDNCPLPMQLIDDPELQQAWWLSYGRFYTWFQYLVDQQIARIMNSLEETGLGENTIVVFCSDHGEYAGAHGGMLQKWYTCYQEAVHVPLVVSAPWLDDGLRPVEALSSHVDIVPTLLGLAGYGAQQRKALARTILGKKVEPLPGADLTPLIYGAKDQVLEPSGDDVRERVGVLFTTADQVSAPLYTDPAQGSGTAGKVLNAAGDFESSGENYLVYLASVEKLRAEGKPLQAGPVVQPNTVQCLRTPQWKLGRYWDPTGKNDDQWELYYLPTDPAEAINVVEVDPVDGQPVPCTDRIANQSRRHPRGGREDAPRASEYASRQARERRIPRRRDPGNRERIARSVGLRNETQHLFRYVLGDAS